METLTPQQIADKIFDLTEQFNQAVYAAPEILNHIPDKATLVFLDADDPIFNRASLALAQTNPRPADSPVVYIKMSKQVRLVQQIEWHPEVVDSPLAI
jgi:hypothetical protein